MPLNVVIRRHVVSLNESPSEKEGKSFALHLYYKPFGPSMKVPPKSKGNPITNFFTGTTFYTALNESPSEKEGK